MKKLLSVLFLFISAYTFGQAYISSDGALHPTGSFPVALSNEIKGSAKRVYTVAQRDAIPMNMRDTGMLCYVTFLDSTFQLSGGISNANWKSFAGTSTTIINQDINTYIDSIFNITNIGDTVINNYISYITDSIIGTNVVQGVQNTIITNPYFTQANAIQAQTYRFSIYSGQTQSVSHGAAGVLVDPLFNSFIVAPKLNVGLLRYGATITDNKKSYPFQKARANGYDVFLSVNYRKVKSGTSSSYPTSSELPQYRTDLKAFLHNYVKGYATKISLENEENNTSYRPNWNAKDYLAMAGAAIQIAHDSGFQITNGGLTGMYFTHWVWQWLVNHGRQSNADTLAKYQFTSGQIPNLGNWSTLPQYSAGTAKMDSLVNGYVTLGWDWVNFHWYEPIVDTTQQTVNTACIGWAIEALHAVTGKTIITNEYGVHNRSIFIPVQLSAKLDSLQVPYRIYYSGDAADGTGAIALQDTTAVLRTNGIAYAAYNASVILSDTVNKETWAMEKGSVYLPTYKKSYRQWLMLDTAGKVVAVDTAGTHGGGGLIPNLQQVATIGSITNNNIGIGMSAGSTLGAKLEIRDTSNQNNYNTNYARFMIRSGGGSDTYGTTSWNSSSEGAGQTHLQFGAGDGFYVSFGGDENNPNFGLVKIDHAGDLTLEGSNMIKIKSYNATNGVEDANLIFGDDLDEENNFFGQKGIRAHNGVMQYKNFDGDWQNMGSGGGSGDGLWQRESENIIAPVNNPDSVKMAALKAYDGANGVYATLVHNDGDWDFFDGFSGMLRNVIGMGHISMNSLDDIPGHAQTIAAATTTGARVHWLQDKTDTLAGLDDIRAAITSVTVGSGNTNSNIGAGNRLAIPNTNNLKTVFGANYLLIDSTTNTNALTFKVDTTSIHTKLYYDNLYQVKGSFVINSGALVSLAALALPPTNTVSASLNKLKSDSTFFGYLYANNGNINGNLIVVNNLSSKYFQAGGIIDGLASGIGTITGYAPLSTTSTTASFRANIYVPATGNMVGSTSIAVWGVASGYDGGNATAGTMVGVRGETDHESYLTTRMDGVQARVGIKSLYGGHALADLPIGSGLHILEPKISTTYGTKITNYFGIVSDTITSSTAATITNTPYTLDLQGTVGIARIEMSNIQFPNLPNYLTGGNRTVVLNTTTGKLETVTTGTGTSAAITSLTDASTITCDASTLSTGYGATVTLGGNRTLTISNATDGQTIHLRVIQDATGSRTLTVTNGRATTTVPALTLNSAANSVTYIALKYEASTSNFVYLSLAY